MRLNPAPAAAAGRARPAEAASTPSADALPAPELVDAWPPARRRPRSRSPRVERRASASSRSAIAVDGVLVERERDAGRRASAGSVRGERSADLGEPRVVGARPAARPQAAASAATIPKASGKVLGMTRASAAGTSVGDLVVLEPAGEVDRCRRPRGRPRRSRPAASARKAREDPERRLARPPSSAAAARRRPRGRRRGRRRPSAGQSRAAPLAYAPKPTSSSRAPGCAGVDQRPGGEQQVDALGDDQLADEDDARAARPRRTSRGSRRPRRRASRPKAPGLGARRSSRRRASARERRAAGLGAAGAARSASTSTPGRAEPGLRGQAVGSSTASQRLSAVWREPTRTPARRVDRPRARRAGSARGAGSPCTRGPSRGPWPRSRRPGAGEDRRAHDQVVGERGVDAAGALDHRRGPRPRWRRGSGRARRRSAPGRSSPRSPRSGRRRRPAAGRRCRAGRR